MSTCATVPFEASKPETEAMRNNHRRNAEPWGRDVREAMPLEEGLQGDRVADVPSGGGRRPVGASGCVVGSGNREFETPQNPLSGGGPREGRHKRDHNPNPDPNLTITQTNGDRSEVILCPPRVFLVRAERRKGGPGLMHTRGRGVPSGGSDQNVRPRIATAF